MGNWPTTRDALIAEQEELGRAVAPEWHSPAGEGWAAGCFICFSPGAPGAGATAWAAAALHLGVRLVAMAVVTGTAAAAYEPGLLALREGPLLERAVRALARQPDVILVNATGTDHPRRAGLALHLGAVLEAPSVGVTHRPLLAEGAWPAEDRGARTELRRGHEVVGCWLRTRRGTRPLAVHAGWRTSPETAVRVALACTAQARTPEPLRQARRAARVARAAALST